MKSSCAQAVTPIEMRPQKVEKVGGYNAFWIDRGEDAIALDGRFRTSLITTPSNGRIPPMNKTGCSENGQNPRGLENHLARP